MSRLSRLESQVERLNKEVFGCEKATEPDYVVINGLKWDRKNTVIEGREHLNWHEALGVAQSLGKRLPTQKEWAALASLGSTWDCEKKGRWFGTDHQLMGRSKRSIFLPAAGFRYYSDGTLYYRGLYGIYWSSTVTNGTSAYYLYFYSSSQHTNNTNKFYGFSVRCVAG
jgi:uncharacterized protein (TIGR02145 family)